MFDIAQAATDPDAPDHEQLARMSLRLGAVQIGVVSPSSNRLYPLFLEPRALLEFPEVVRRVCSGVAAAVQRCHYDWICGVCSGGLPFAAIVAQLLARPLCYVRTGGHPILGLAPTPQPPPGARLLLVDDAAGIGKTKRPIVDRLAAAGYRVSDIAVVTELGFRRHWQSLGIQMHSVLTVNDFRLPMQRLGILPVRCAELLSEWLRSEDGWDAAHPQAIQFVEEARAHQAQVRLEAFREPTVKD